MWENIAFFRTKREKNHLIINIELASCPNFFVWDCLKEEFKECHSTRSNKAWKRGESRVKLTSATKKKQHRMASFIWVGTKKGKVMFLNDLLQ